MNEKNVLSLKYYNEYANSRNNKKSLTHLDLEVFSGQIVGLFSQDTNKIDDLFFNLNQKAKEADGMIFVDGHILGMESNNLSKNINKKFVNFSDDDWKNSFDDSVFNFLMNKISSYRNIKEDVLNFIENMKSENAFREVLETNLSTFQEQCINETNEFVLLKLDEINRLFQKLNKQECCKILQQVTLYEEIFKNLFFAKEISLGIIAKKWIGLFNYYFTNANKTKAISKKITKYFDAKEHLRNTILVSKIDVVDTDELNFLKKRKKILENYENDLKSTWEQNTLILRKHVFSLRKRSSYFKRIFNNIKDRTKSYHLEIYCQLIITKKSSKMFDKNIFNLRYLSRENIFKLFEDWQNYNSSFLNDPSFFTKELSIKEVKRSIRHHYNFNIQAYMDLSLKTNDEKTEFIKNERNELAKLDSIEVTGSTRGSEVEINKAKSDFDWEEKMFVENYQSVINNQKNRIKFLRKELDSNNEKLLKIFKEVRKLFKELKRYQVLDFDKKHRVSLLKIHHYSSSFELLHRDQDKFLDVEFKDFRNLITIKRDLAWKNIVTAICTKANIIKGFNEQRLFKFLLLKNFSDLTDIEFLNIISITKFFGRPKLLIFHSNFWRKKLNNNIITIVKKYVKNHDAGAIFISNKRDEVLANTESLYSFYNDRFIEWGKTKEIVENSKHPVTKYFFRDIIVKNFQDSEIDFKVWKINDDHKIQCSANSFYNWTKAHPIGHTPTIELSLMDDISEAKLKKFKDKTKIDEFTILNITHKLRS